MKAIAITPQNILNNEAEYIRTILDHGWDWVHLRHPESSADSLRSLLDKIPHDYYDRLKPHDNFDVAIEYRLGGIHLNSRNTIAPDSFRGSISKSCHTIEDIKSAQNIDYATLSPIFNSVSKAGYNAAFSADDLARINFSDHVIALGGITPSNMTRLKQYNFDGFAVLGYIFQSDSIKELQKRLNEFTPYLCYNS